MRGMIAVYDAVYECVATEASDRALLRHLVPSRQPALSSGQRHRTVPPFPPTTGWQAVARRARLQMAETPGDQLPTIEWAEPDALLNAGLVATEAGEQTAKDPRWGRHRRFGGGRGPTA